MSQSKRFVFVSALLVLALVTAGFGQAGDPEAAAAVAGGTPGYSRVAPIPYDHTQLPQFTIGSSTVLDMSGAVVGAGGNGPSGPSNNAGITSSGILGGVIPGLDTVPTFDGAFFAQAGPSSSSTRLWRFSVIGRDPVRGGTTTIPMMISEVSLQLLNADGSVFKVVDFAPFDDLTEDSPNFSFTDYRSGHHIQLQDAIQRAEFFHGRGEDWHTNLRHRVVNKVTITVPFFVNIQLSNGTIIQARSYFTGTAADGSTFVLMLSPLFNFFFDNEVVNEINLGNFDNHAMNMTLFPNTYLFNLNVNNPNVPGGCCVLGFHTYFLDSSAVPQPRWVTQYASWISPGLFGAGFQDVTALSHETSEAFNDPFVDNATPNWQFPGVPANAKVCQNNLETGDPVEVLANATVPIFVRERHEIFTYHPQNEALIQWFEMGTTSDAIDGAFSFPDETVLPHSALPCPQ
jgi:hypothetical protein